MTVHCLHVGLLSKFIDRKPPVAQIKCDASQDKWAGAVHYNIVVDTPIT